MAITEEVRKAYFNALYSQQNGSNASMHVFKEEYPLEYAKINSIYHKRVNLRFCIDAMNTHSHNNVYWGALTFNEEKDKNNITWKRKEAQEHLKKCFSLYCMVEEFGEENGRYHIHFIGVFDKDKTMDDFFSWHSRTHIEKVVSVKRVARYLCDYMTKDIPRIRRSKNLVKLCNNLKKCYYYENIGFGDSLGFEYWNKAFEDLLPF